MTHTCRQDRQERWRGLYRTHFMGWELFASINCLRLNEKVGMASCNTLPLRGPESTMKGFILGMLLRRSENSSSRDRSYVGGRLSLYLFYCWTCSRWRLHTGEYQLSYVVGRFQDLFPTTGLCGSQDTWLSEEWFFRPLCSLLFTRSSRVNHGQSYRLQHYLFLYQ